jgi:3-deoxy-D-manno-oct-2-ulosonic acid (Kdo) hydroxylase
MRARGGPIPDGRFATATLNCPAPMSSLVTLDLATWRPVLAPEAQRDAARSLESGAVLVLPWLAFEMSGSERRFLSPQWSDGRAKNISLDGQTLRGARGPTPDLADLTAMIARFAASASELVTALFPAYAAHVKTARTSYRPQPAVGRAVSWRKDDSRLHVDAFPSRPNHGERILRVFSNVNPTEPRVWRVGEPFESMAKTLLPRIARPLPGAAVVLAAVRATKGLRTEYDHLMLGLHDRAKADLAYQRDCVQETVPFAPGTTWLCFSDQVMHAALSGQYMLEQTIHLPLSALYEPERAPLAILERLTGRTLTLSR